MWITECRMTRGLAKIDSAIRTQGLGARTKWLARGSRFCRVCLLGWLLVGPAAALRGGESPEAFLEALRAAGMNDLAARYLDRLQSKGGSPELLARLDYERAMIALAEGEAARSTAVRDRNLSTAEAALQRFVDQNPQHPLFTEAALRLGSLLLVQGKLREASGDAKAAEQAVPVFDRAAQRFDALAEFLRGELQAMRGAKIDPTADPEKKALRDRYRGEYLQALLLGGEARQRAAALLQPNDPKRRERLTAAQQRFAELSDKYAEYLQGVVAQLYLGRVREDLGETPAALDSYQRVMEVGDSDAVRPFKTQALARAVNLWSRPEQGQASAAVERGKAWLTTMRRDEEAAPEWLELRLAVADAMANAADAQEAGPPQRNLRREARVIARDLARQPSPQQGPARELLTRLGVDAEDQPGANDVANQDLEALKTFDDCLEAGRKAIESSDTINLSLEIIEKSIAGTQDEQARKAAEQQRREMTAERQQLLARAATALQRALRLANGSTDINSLNQARYYLAYVQLRGDEFYDAAVLGEFVTRRFPNDPNALQAGLIALSALQNLAVAHAERGTAAESGTDAASTQTSGSARRLESLADYLLQRWPDDPNAASASQLLIRLAILGNRWDDAERFVARLPPGTETAQAQARLLGQAQWNAALAAQQAGDGPQSEKLLDRAAQNLELGLGLKAPASGAATPVAATPDNDAWLSALVLAKVRMRRQRLMDVDAILRHPQFGPLTAGDSLPSNLQADCYRLGLQALVARLAQGAGNNGQALSEAEQLIGRLRTVAGSGPEGATRLVSLFYGLAEDLKQQLATTPPAGKTPLVAALRLLLQQLADQAPDASTMHWAAQTLSSLGDSLANDPVAGQASQETLATAAEIYRKLLERESAAPGFIDSPELQRQIEFELAKADRRQGKYKEAIDRLSKILTANNMMVDAQVEAALTYQQWAKTGSPDLYKAAMLGGRKNAETGKNLIWGWGKISQSTASNPNFRSTFFESRYRLAECRVLLAQRVSNAEERKNLLVQAGRDIDAVSKLYPDLGGPEFQQRFAGLRAEIKRLGGS